MTKTKEELNELKEKYDSLVNKLKELDEDELTYIVSGYASGESKDVIIRNSSLALYKIRESLFEVISIPAFKTIFDAVENAIIALSGKNVSAAMRYIMTDGMKNLKYLYPDYISTADLLYNKLYNVYTYLQYAE